MQTQARVQLRLTLTDIALLTRVQRPVVSMWRTRSRDTAAPFPAPADVENALELFDAAELLDWLAATGRGNNPNAAEDIAAFAALDGFRRHPGRHVAGITALLTLRRLLDRPLHGLITDDLLDEADAVDPDDGFLYSELEALGEDLPRIAAYTDLLADAAYSPEAAFEKLMADRFRNGQREQAAAAFTQEAIDLLAAAAVELGSSQPNREVPVFVDGTAGGSDLLMQIVRYSGEDAHLTFMTTANDDDVSRLLRRRLRIHGVQWKNLEGDAAGRFGLTGPVVHVAQFPPPGHRDMSPVQILTTVENIMLQMNDEQRGVIIGPAGVLVDALASQEADDLRSGLLRLGTLRAAVRLPQGLLKMKPRQAQALWVLGPSQRDVDIAERWTMVADLSGQDLTADVREDVISDLAASMGSRAVLRAHSFRFARLVYTRTLLAGRGSLLHTATPPSATASGSEAAARIDALVGALNEEPAPTRLELDLEAANSDVYPAPSTVGEMIAAGNLKYLPGNRLDERLLMSRGTGRVCLLGLPELLGQTEPGDRRIDQLVLAATYPAARRTEPGDVVFCTGERTAAWVDAKGGAVVSFPVRVLRISDTDPGGLLAEVLAADINAAPSNGGRWKRWPVRRLPETAQAPLKAALHELREVREQARRRLDALTELESLIVDGATGSRLKIVSMKGTG
ncbi:hypothetical protein [Arthrobacter mangrovi]|uniref:Uncharacterized protein n=1 Tax=Arthrobacter mangrovi TaxID=2966350 RepID=A0ABQ5MXR8_9MICC|nr:hypothetical protein [Arthrobacter mangrovi]GLB68749.1 hypothetical protein AHIS1636_31910 [Arthrobacter mangrovi]